MEPRIHYAKTADGVSIAFWTLGKGKPFVQMPLLESHIEMEWHFRGFRRWYERMAQHGMVVRYDRRGCGLSERDVTDYSLDAFVSDLEAVVDRLGLESFPLMGLMFSGPVAIAYAVRHPERVSHLILWGTWARGSDFLRSPQVQAQRALIGKDWDFYTESTAQFVYGWSGGEGARRTAVFMREAITPEALEASFEAAGDFDVTSSLEQVRSPTLILHRRQAPYPGLDVARGLASQIPDARLVVLEGEAALPWLADTNAVLEAIDEFLGEGEAAAPAAALPEGMAVLLFADIAESTALTEQLGDAAFRAKARELDTSLRSVIRESGGTPVEGKVLGDGVLAVFTSARGAIDCALRCEAAGEPLGLRLHLGIHAGDVIREGNNVYGGAVNIAARVASASAPGEILVSDIVRGLARTSAGVAFDDRGEHELKGVGEPQRLFAVRGGS
jgi:class 3 adenylate cyclase